MVHLWLCQMMYRIDFSGFKNHINEESGRLRKIFRLNIPNCQFDLHWFLQTIRIFPSQPGGVLLRLLRSQQNQLGLNFALQSTIFTRITDLDGYDITTYICTYDIITLWHIPNIPIYTVWEYERITLIIVNVRSYLQHRLVVFILGRERPPALGSLLFEEI